MAWASRRTYFEPTALKLVWTPAGLKVIDLADYLSIAARIEVASDAVPMCWAGYRHRVLGQPLLTKRDRAFAIQQLATLEQYGRRVGGDPADWFCSPEPIRSKHWLGIEIYNGDRWVEAEAGSAVSDIRCRQMQVA